MSNSRVRESLERLHRVFLERPGGRQEVEPAGERDVAEWTSV
jgi:hypothetical protein